jgi:antitoxin (DNA-binding transcriptional repressor) of toxin-antitoxin stability system
VVTDHGHPIAPIVPLRPSPFEQLMREGRATDSGPSMRSTLPPRWRLARSSGSCSSTTFACARLPKPAAFRWVRRFEGDGVSRGGVNPMREFGHR